MLLPSLVAFLLLRTVFWFVTFPNPDEAYYWLWGQHPGLSYYDHPPLHAWIQGGFTAVLGRSNFVLRLPNLLSNGLFFYTYYRIVQYLYGQNKQRYFWITVMLILASPLYFLFLALAWHDHWLITFSLIASYQFVRFLDSYLADGRGESRRLYGAAIALGLALLCKYNAVFVLAGFIATVLADARLRSLWRDQRIYIAGAIVVSALLPILLWNFSNHFQSFQYYFNRSVNTGGFSLKLSPFINFVLFSYLTVSPVNWFAFIRVLKRPDPKIQKFSVYPQLAFWVFILSTLALTVISLLSAALYYWNITAYLLLFPLAAAVFFPAPSPSPSPPLSRRPLFIGGQLYGLLFALVLVIHYSFLPLSALGSPTEDPDSRMLFGWEQVQVAIDREKGKLTQPFLVTSDYRSASALAYQLDNPDVMAVSDRIDQFDFWYDSDRPFKGRDAVIVIDDWHPILPEFLAQFERTTTPTTVPVTRFGVWIKNYYVLRGYGFKGGRVS
jgi:4-amino-4-deoxy-L-arabinose transferase-like glycosyltransferase